MELEVLKKNPGPSFSLEEIDFSFWRKSTFVAWNAQYKGMKQSGRKKKFLFQRAEWNSLIHLQEIRRRRRMKSILDMKARTKSLQGRQIIKAKSKHRKTKHLEGTKEIYNFPWFFLALFLPCAGMDLERPMNRILKNKSIKGKNNPSHQILLRTCNVAEPTMS